MKYPVLQTKLQKITIERHFRGACFARAHCYPDVYTHLWQTRSAALKLAFSCRIISGTGFALTMKNRRSG
jgi:hypothetical protein